MIGFAPFGGDSPPPRRPRLVKSRVAPHERTECNYLVIFFIVGVLALAMGDAVKR